MAIDKIQSESINLADNFAFTGTVTGAGESNIPYFDVAPSSNIAYSDNTSHTIQLATVNKDTASGLRKTLRIMTGSQGVSNFRPTAAHAIYSRFLPEGGTTWDMSGGYGGRLLGAIKSQINYIATEPASDTVKGLNEIIVDFGYISNIFRKIPHMEIVQKGSEDFLPDKESLDLCFTSPPYFNTEKYSDEETQSYIKFPTQDEWVEGFLRKTIQNCRYGLKPNRYMLINIADVKSFNHLEDTTVWIAEQEGFVLEDGYSLALSKIQGEGFKYEPIFVFRKI